MKIGFKSWMFTGRDSVDLFDQTMKNEWKLLISGVGIGFDAMGVFSIESNHHAAGPGNTRHHTRFDKCFRYASMDHDFVVATGL